jgi:hypothetical protein
MMKNSLLFTIFYFISIALKAQAPIDNLNELVAKSPIQKVYLQLDRDNYVAGEIAQFKAYLSADFLPDTINTNIYVELLDGAKVISKSAFPVFFATATGSISFPDTLSTGYYTIRSFSRGMLAQKDDYFFQRKIYVYGAIKKQNAVLKDTLRIEFFPEGGNIVTGFSGSVAFKASDRNGMPVSVEGNLYNDKNEELATFYSLHDGMGLFDLEPLEGEKYHIKLKNTSPENKYFLPEAIAKGVALSMVSDQGDATFSIKQNPANSDFVAAYIIGQMQHHVVFKKEFTTSKDLLKGTIKTKNLPSGIMQVTVFNKANMPLAERLYFVNNNEYAMQTDIKTDTLDVSAGGFNKFFVNIKDTVQGQISVAITDPSFYINVIRENNIISSMLLTSDLNGYILNPAWYLSSTVDSVKNALDILMMVNGWSRFTWSEIKKLPLNNNGSNAYITLKGKVTLEDSKKPFSNKKMLLIINSMIDKRKKTTQLIDTDINGYFKLDSLVLFDKSRLFFTDIRGKKSSLIDVYLDKDTLFAGTSIAAKNVKLQKFKNEIFYNDLQLQYDASQKAKGTLLKAVVVTAKKKSAIELVEEKYASELFSTNSSNTFDLVNSNDATAYPNIFEYLKLRVNGLIVQYADGEYKLFYRQMTNASDLGNPTMTVFLDEVETDVSFISSIPAYQIALVKVYSSFIGAVGNGAGGALAIYTKKTEDYKDGSLQNNLKMYNGYTITKEFYAPNYKVTKIGLDTDYRTTLDWRPQIFINNINPQIPLSFYNNNRTKKFKIVVEGMTSDGKLIWLEKIIIP